MSCETICHCDRCGKREQFHLLQRFKVEFNTRYLSPYATNLGSITTPELCPECAEDWAKTFYNEIKDWCGKKKGVK